MWFSFLLVPPTSTVMLPTFFSFLLSFFENACGFNNKKYYHDVVKCLDNITCINFLFANINKGEIT
jgi:hypothetical protein